MPKTTPKKSTDHPKQLQKCLTGIKGFDEITEGGLPKNRTTLVSGGAGSGKTLLNGYFTGKTAYRQAFWLNDIFANCSFHLVPYYNQPRYLLLLPI
jgi:hypothetical protein